MKKLVLITMLVLGSMAVVFNSYAEMDKKEGMMGDMKAHMMQKGKMMSGCPMMKSMMERTVVATSDGGIVIIMGNTITKYDKNLNVVKEVELKMSMEGMHKMMGEMKGMCPMMGKEMGKDDDSAAGAEAVPEASGHEGHH